MSGEVEKKFEATVRALLNTPPSTQKAVAKRGRRKRLRWKADQAALDYLISVARAYADHDEYDDDTVMRYIECAADFADALEDFKRLRDVSAEASNT